MKVITINQPSKLHEYLEAFKDLAASAVSENIFYEHWMLLPALELLKGENVAIALVSSTDGKTLHGIFPLEIKSKYHRLPVKYFSMWRHMHCFLSTPIVRSGSEQRCLTTFFDWLFTQTHGRYLFQFEHIAADDLFYDHLMHFIRNNGLKFERVENYQRPALRSLLDGQSYLNASISSKHRKDLRSKLRKLEQIGNIKYELLCESSQLDSWNEDFLNLESSGWKGREDSAMRCRENEALFFSKITRNAFIEKRLMFFRMTLDEKPIAMRCGFLGYEGAFSFKIAFDEAFAKHSPGVLLELEHINYIQNQSDVQWVDSCSMPGSDTLGRVWKENRTISSIVVSSNSRASKLLVSSISYLKSLKGLRQETSLG